MTGCSPQPTPYYQDDWVTLYHGDCRVLVPSLEFDVIVTDPPYGIGANRMTLGSRPKWRRLDRGETDWDAATPDLEFLLDSGAPCVVWGGNHFDLPPSRGWLVWDKDNGETDYADCELAWSNVDRALRRRVHRWHGAHARERHEERLHPTQKPVPIMRWAIEWAGGGVVLDPFAGSGSTLVAARDLRQKSIGVEIEERYCEIAATRCSQDVLDFGTAA